MRILWKILKKSFDFILALGGLVGVIYLAQDVEELPDALKKWRALVPIDRETTLVIFASILILYIGWMDARPTFIKWFDRRRSTKLDAPKEILSLERFIRASKSFTLEEAACLLAECEMTNKELSGPSAGILNDLKSKLRQGEIEPVNTPDGNIYVPLTQNERMQRIVGQPVSRRFYSNLEIGKDDLKKLAELYESNIPGLN